MYNRQKNYVRMDTFGISLMKIRKKRGPNIEPWGIPAKISFQFEV